MWDYPSNIALAAAGYSVDFTRPWMLTTLAAIVLILWISSRSRVAASAMRRRIANLLRVLAVAALALALAGARLVRQSELVCVSLLVDQSASIDPDQRQRELDRLAVRLSVMEKNHRLAVLGFAGRSVLQQLADSDSTIAAMQGQFNSEFTDIGQAIRLAVSTAPPDAANRLVILTDGRDSVNQSTAIKAAEAASAAGIAIDVMPLDSPGGGDIRVERLALEPQVDAEEMFQIRCVIHSDSSRQARMLMYRRGMPVSISDDPADAHGRLITLKPGYNLVEVDYQKLDVGGFYDYEVRIEPVGSDRLAANNSASGVVHVTGQAQVLIVDGSGDMRQGNNLLAALRLSGVKATLVEALQMPDSALEMGSISCLVFSDVPADAMSEAQMALIRNWVRSGGGFVWVGGTNSYGPGGYAGTPIEEISPVSCEVKRVIERASLALAIAIDQSGSMGAVVSGGDTKMDLANNASASAVKLLDSRDMAGITMVDTDYKWITKPSLLRMDPSNQKSLVRKVLANKPGGGGIYCLTALRAAYNALKNAPASSRHVLLFADTDDCDQRPGCNKLVSQMNTDGITVSCVGLGLPSSGNFGRFLKELARRGKGRVYFTDDPKKLPKMFIRDVSMASRNAFIEPSGGIVPAIVAASDGAPDPILRGIPAPPRLAGQVATTLKGRSRLLMHGPKAEDALLARWSFGLGKSVAWTSDAVGHWAGSWVSWEAFSQFWTQIVRWAEKNANLDSPVSTWTTIRGDKGIIVSEAVDEDGNSITDMDLHAVIESADPAVPARKIALRQTSPGRYEGQYPVDKRGAYVVTVAGSDSVAMDAAAAALSYSPEFSASGADMAFINALADAGGGRVLDDNAELFLKPETPSYTHRPISQHLLFIGLMFFFLDIVARRLVLPDWLVKRFGSASSDKGRDAATVKRSSKSSFCSKSPASVAVSSSAGGQSDSGTLDEILTEADSGISAGGSEKPNFAGGPRRGSSPTPQQTTMSMSERLRAAKKRARQEIEDIEKGKDDQAT